MNSRKRHLSFNMSQKDPERKIQFSKKFKTSKKTLSADNDLAKQRSQKALNSKIKVSNSSETKTETICEISHEHENLNHDHVFDDIFEKQPVVLLNDMLSKQSMVLVDYILEKQPIVLLDDIAKQPSTSGISLDGYRLTSQNPDKKRRACDKDIETIIDKNVPVGLEATKSTLNAIPDDINNVDNDVIELEIFYKALPAQSDLLLKVFNRNMPRPKYRCIKCNKLFLRMKSGAIHCCSCNSRLKRKMLINLNEVAIFCTICYFRCSVISEIVIHRKACSQSSSNPSISECLTDNVSKNFMCSKCGCDRLSSFSQHPCDERLEHMKSCTVNLEKLSPEYLNSCPSPSLKKGECSGERVFCDYVSFNKHAEIDLNDGELGMLLMKHGRSLVIKKIKEIIKENEDCETPEEVMERLITPISKLIEPVREKSNSLPELDLNLFLTPRLQKLVEDLCLNSRTKKDKSVVDFLNFKNIFDEDDDGDDKTTDHVIANAITSSRWKKFKCTCEKNKDKPSDEEKPCFECLHKFMEASSASECQPLPSPEEWKKFKCMCGKPPKNPDDHIKEKLCSKCLQKFLEEYSLSESRAVPSSEET